MAGGFSIWNNYVSFSRQQKHKAREEQLRHIEEVFDCIDKVENAIKSMHTYETPEIIAVPIVKGSKEYRVLYLSNKL